MEHISQTIAFVDKIEQNFWMKITMNETFYAGFSILLIFSSTDSKGTIVNCNNIPKKPLSLHWKVYRSVVILYLFTSPKSRISPIEIIDSKHDIYSKL